MLAKSNGLLVAMAKILTECHRIKHNGKHLIVQKSATLNITSSAKQTKCGYEPVYNNIPLEEMVIVSILHSFQRSIVYLEHRKTRVDPAISYASSGYIETNFQITYKCMFLQNKAFETNEFEQLNVLNELVSRIHEENRDSLSSLVLNARSESRFWTLSSWTFTSKSLFFTVSGIFLFSVVLYAFISFARLRIQRHQEELTNLAIRLQEASLRRNQLAESAM
jgi:hypothetical protein